MKSFKLGSVAVLAPAISWLASVAQAQSSTGGSWQQFIVGPQSRLVLPSSIISISGNVSNPTGLLPGGQGPTILTRPTAADLPPTITVDFGMNTVGFLSISFAGASTNTPGIRLAFSETQQYLTNSSDFTRSFNGDTITPGTDQIAVSSTPFTWTDANGCANGTKVCADGLHGFRYLRIYLDALAADSPITQAFGTVEISSISLNFTGLLGTPDAFLGWFESSDDQLNQFWFDAAYTNEMITDTARSTDVDPRNAASPTLLGKIVLLDGAKRDRDPYVGDIAVSGRTNYLTHYIGDACRDVIADLADHQRSDGWIPPASINDYTLLLFDYPLWWVVTSWDYVLYTGNVTYATTYYPNLIKVLDSFYPSVTDPNGLLSNAANSGYGDYAFLPRDGEITYFNALYVLALQNAASIAQTLGNPSDAERWLQRASLVSDAINTVLWDPSVGAYLDSANDTVRHMQDGNGIAVIAGVANITRATSALNYLGNTTALPYGNAFCDNDSLFAGSSQRVYAFISYFDIQARLLSGLSASALDEIRRLYTWMQTQDPGITFWEGIGPNGTLYEQAFTSAAHGWSTGVLPVLSNYILGATPTGPGFVTWTVKPFPADLTWANGQLPTMFGPLTVNWTLEAPNTTFSLTINAPSGTSGNISVPSANQTAPVTVDGAVAWDGQQGLLFNAEWQNGYVALAGIPSGAHSVAVE